MSPLGVLRVTEKLILFPLMVPVTGASPRWPFSVPVSFEPSCCSVSVCVITAPPRPGALRSHAPSTFASCAEATCASERTRKQSPATKMEFLFIAILFFA